MSLSQDILERFRVAHGKDIDLGLKPPFEHLLNALGAPHRSLPPTIIVAGTNGKGSTCAFLRAMIEASGHTAHVYTSPHLVSFNERIRVAGNLISEEALAAILTEAERLAEPAGVSLFEAITAAALTAFARTQADATILEVGLGGRLDATNIVPRPVACIISRLSFDHRHYLGDTMAQIAFEKAGIMRNGTPCFVANQPSSEAFTALQEQAMEKGAILQVGAMDWRVEKTDAAHFRFVSATRTIENIPVPALIGTHQILNAGLAIAASSALPFEISDEAVRTAMTQVKWAGRLQRLTEGPLMARLKQGSELWLDGGHNDSAGEVLAAQMRKWMEESDKPIDLIYGMLTSKKPSEFLAPLLPFIGRVRTLKVDGEVCGFQAADLAAEVRALGVTDVKACETIPQALEDLQQSTDTPTRTLVCGSLYLVGQALKDNGAVTA